MRAEAGLTAFHGCPPRTAVIDAEARGGALIRFMSAVQLTGEYFSSETTGSVPTSWAWASRGTFRSTSSAPCSSSACTFPSSDPPPITTCEWGLGCTRLWRVDARGRAHFRASRPHGADGMAAATRSDPEPLPGIDPGKCSHPMYGPARFTIQVCRGLRPGIPRPLRPWDAFPWFLRFSSHWSNPVSAWR